MTKTHSWSFAALGAILLMGFVLRIGQIGESLWLDELHTAWVIDGTLREIPPRAAIGNQSPLYFLLPWASTKLFGMNEVALRLPSLVAGLALIAAIYALVWQMTASHAAALLAAWLAAIDPNFLYYSLEARPYAWVQLIGVLQVFAFWQTLARPTWNWRVALVVLSLMLFYLHYTAVLLIAVEVVYFTAAKLLSRETPKYSALMALSDLAIFALCCLPACVHLQAIAGRREAWWKFVPREPSPVALVEMFPLGITIGLPLVFVAAGRIVRWWRREPRKQENAIAPILLGLLWLGVPLLLAFGATTFELAPLWMRRYVIVSGAAPIVTAGVLCAAAGTRALRMAAALIVAVAAAWLLGPQWQFLSDGRWVARSTQNWRSAVAEINGDAESSKWPVLVRSGLIEADALRGSGDERLRDYCLLPVRSIYGVDADGRPLIPLEFSQPSPLSAVEFEKLRIHDGLWIVTPGNERTKDATVLGVRRALRERKITATKEHAAAFGSVWLVRLNLQPQREPHAESADG